MTAEPRIQAIETEYAGHRFRSRLEARWAVFFDALGIRWEYEPQGFEVGGVAYLPDFRLPEMHDKPFVEVKGSLDAAGAEKVLRLASSGEDVILLGDIPDAGMGGPDFHILCGHNRGDWVVRIHSACWLPGRRGGWCGVPLGWGVDIRDLDDPNITKTFPGMLSDRVLASTNGWVTRPAAVEGAYRAARSARFEHGESGAPRSFTRQSQRGA